MLWIFSAKLNWKKLGDDEICMKNEEQLYFQFLFGMSEFYTHFNIAKNYETTVLIILIARLDCPL